MEWNSGFAHWGTTPELWRKLKPLARQKRRAPTPAEKALRQRLRNHSLEHTKFRRQQPIERFIVDYCSEVALVIEVDGEIHQYTKEEDAIRQEFLEYLGLVVLRFSNAEVFSCVDDVLRQIASTLHLRRQTLGPSPRAPKAHRKPKNS